MILQENLQGFQHLGLPVTDLERSKAFYANFGFVERMCTDLPRPSGPVQVTMMEKAGFVIELYQPSAARIEEIGARTDGHIDHIAFDVLDIESAYTEIKQAGFEILEADAPVFLPFWSRGVKFFTIRGPDGEKVEFNQML